MINTPLQSACTTGRQRLQHVAAFALIWVRPLMVQSVRAVPMYRLQSHPAPMALGGLR